MTVKVVVEYEGDLLSTLALLLQQYLQDMQGLPYCSQTQARSCAGIFTATDIQQISRLYQDSLLAVEKDGTFQVHPYYPRRLAAVLVHFTSIECLCLSCM